MQKTQSRVGISITAAYFALLIAWYWDQPRLIADLKPNELGDFLAGVFGPVAFFWLVLGYFQQGEELRQNTNALEMQAQELKHSVEHQGEMVVVARQQLQTQIDAIKEEAERRVRAAKPKFRFTKVGHSIGSFGILLNIRCQNVGNTATDINLAFTNTELSGSPSPVPRLATGDYWDIQCKVPERLVLPTELRILYTDALAVGGVAVFRIDQKPNGDRFDWTFHEEQV
ncbi:hypothetical protein MNR01_02390 [Lysobacter sp. S4-A87]|uniref:hypothetical protein n=1 Tax=Lysobacter sp. S4-A87 TaxID=2925843 RepID=UPI001F533F8A|nr:hypothetical protein [Lysobacter sp. S4-A87]UNK49907.1 hypothetical protein MNR01_02390 [Lysobacter sp. S4-A87]